MDVLIALSQVPFLRRPVDQLAEELRNALDSAGHAAEILRIPFKWHPLDRVPDQLLACRLLDLESDIHFPGDILIALEFPAYLVHHSHKVLWLAHHRQGPGAPSRKRSTQHDAATETALECCDEADRRLLSTAVELFSVSATASYQVHRWTGMNATPLYAPPRAHSLFFWQPAEDYLLVPAGLCDQRLALVFAALERCSKQVRARFVAPDDRPEPSDVYLAAASAPALQDRVEWLAGLDGVELVEQVAYCRGVLFPAFDEVLPWVAFEAMLASKPLLACYDSGAPAELVIPGETGFLSAADADSLAAAVDALWQDSRLARVMGTAARVSFERLGVSWEKTVARLVSST